MIGLGGLDMKKTGVFESKTEFQDRWDIFSPCCEDKTQKANSPRISEELEVKKRRKGRKIVTISNRGDRNLLILT